MASTTGALQALTFNSRALMRPMRLRVYLPPGFEQTGRAYPAAYLLHPWGADENWWVDHLTLPQLADRLITAGAVPAFVAVMPQGDKSFFINAADAGRDYSPATRLDPHHYAGALERYGDYGDYITDDLLAFAGSRFPLRADRAGRAIAGVGMGAAGAAALAFTHPALFGAVGIHSPTLFSGQRLGPPWIFGLNDPAASARRDPVQLARSLDPAAGLRIYLDCGLGDEMSDLTADLHWALEERRVQHSYFSRPGAGDETYWSAHLGEYLGFYT